MNTQTQEQLYRDGAGAYNPNGVSGFLDNPYLQGPGHEEEAQVWWRGYNDARARARAFNKNAPS